MGQNRRMKFFLILLCFFLGQPVKAKIEINPYRHSSWNNDWNESIIQELNQRQEAAIMSSKIDESDLLELNCPGYNYIENLESKKDFWIVFFSSLVRAESAFNTKVRSVAPKGGHGNYGLLQLSKATAREQCGLNSLEELTDPQEHLRCGVKLMSWQLEGAPGKSGKLIRPDLKGQLFGKHILLWGPLRQNDKRGRKLLVNWFKSHLDQLPFCKA
jgi:hypothetical protein